MFSLIRFKFESYFPKWHFDSFLPGKEEVKMSSLDICAEVADSVSSLLNPRLFHEESMGLIASCSVNRQTENR